MPLDTKQQKWLPMGLYPQDIATGSSCPDTPFPELGKVYAAEHRFCCLQPPFPALLFNSKQACGKQISCLNGLSSCAAAPEGAVKSSRKRFIVFDQSGNQTRLLQCGFPLRFPSPVAAEPRKILGSLNPEKGLSNDHAIPEKTLFHDDHVENDYNGEEESEMREDTKEIDALLYSDDEEDNDDFESDDDDDEVMSTGHSPFLVEQQACNKTTEELDETETRDADDGPHRKRQKLLDHSHRESSPFECTKSYTNISSKQETGSGLSEELSRRTDKIQTALRILESIVPGAKGKEALLLVDEAIDYLKLLKRNLNS